MWHDYRYQYCPIVPFSIYRRLWLSIYTQFQTESVHPIASFRFIGSTMIQLVFLSLAHKDLHMISLRSLLLPLPTSFNWPSLALYTLDPFTRSWGYPLYLRQWSAILLTNLFLVARTSYFNAIIAGYYIVTICNRTNQSISCCSYFVPLT